MATTQKTLCDPHVGNHWTKDLVIFEKVEEIEITWLMDLFGPSLCYSIFMYITFLIFVDWQLSFYKILLVFFWCDGS